MSSWDDLFRRMRDAEETAFRMYMELRKSPGDVLYHETSGCFTRGYLLHRLPAEIERAEQFGRPFSCALFQFGRDVFVSEPNLVRRVLTTFLNPVVVAVEYRPDALLLLLPEADAAEAGAKVDVLVDGFVIAGVSARRDLKVAHVTLTGETRYGAAWVLEELERLAAPARELPLSERRLGAERPDPHLARASITRAEEAPDGDAPAAVVDAAKPTAVGFVEGGERPVSFWFDGELLRIDEVLTDEAHEQGRSLLVRSSGGLFRLEEQSGRWSAAPHVEAGDPVD